MIGWREWLAIPTLDIPRIKAKVDTGARTSSLYADRLHIVTEQGAPHAAFVVHPVQRRRRPAIDCLVPLIDERVVTSSNGERQRRPIIRVSVSLAGLTWPIEVSLADRDAMGFRMLLGREAVRRRFLIDPGRSFIADGEAVRVTYLRRKTGHPP